MFLGVLKYNPVGVTKGVGVALMLLTSAIEASRPSLLSLSNEPDDEGRLPSRKVREEREQRETQAEAGEVLALSRQASTRKASPNGKENNKVRKGLQKWATKRGRHISKFRALLNLSRNISPADAQLTRELATLIHVECAAKVRKSDRAPSIFHVSRDHFQIYRYYYTAILNRTSGICGAVHHHG